VVQAVLFILRARCDFTRVLLKAIQPGPEARAPAVLALATEGWGAQEAQFFLGPTWQQTGVLLPPMRPEMVENRAWGVSMKISVVKVVPKAPTAEKRAAFSAPIQSFCTLVL
jgi:hypothetical protein